MKELKYKSNIWLYTIEENKIKNSFKVTFLKPTKLIANSSDSTIDFKVENEKRKKKIEQMLESAINKKYNEKIEDSFKTKIKIFLFDQANDKKIIEYLEVTSTEDITSTFTTFKLKNNIVNKYSTEYYQFSRKENSLYEKIDNNLLTVDNNYILANKYLKKNLNKYSKIYDILLNEYRKEEPINREDFNSLITNTSCSYCGITLDQIEELGANGELHNKRSETRGYTLEIDRKEPNLEYTKDNCCMSCYWCNNAKTDEFSVEDFKEIARGINAVWNQRMKSSGIKETICFPDN
jgi:hypothetical protein